VLIGQFPGLVCRCSERARARETHLLLLALLLVDGLDLGLELAERLVRDGDGLGGERALLDRLGRGVLHGELDELAVRLADEREGTVGARGREDQLGPRRAGAGVEVRRKRTHRPLRPARAVRPTRCR